MDLKTEIFDSMKAAMKDKNKSRVAALRLIRDAVQKAEIADNVELDDAGVTVVLGKLEKQRLESIESYRAGGRDDLAESETRELEIIREFMPEPFTEDELAALVDRAIRESGARGPKQMGLVMKALKGKYEGRAPGKTVSEQVKKQLALLE